MSKPQEIINALWDDFYAKNKPELDKAINMILIYDKTPAFKIEWDKGKQDLVFEVVDLRKTKGSDDGSEK